MTAATVTQSFDSVIMAEENVILTVTDGETYTSKLSNPELVQITCAEDMASETNSPSYTISGRTITIYADGVTDKKMALTIKGRM